MNVILNVIVLIFEILYYALFMKFARKEGKFCKYLISFILITMLGAIINTNYLISYAVLVFCILYSLKYIVKLKITLYDILLIFVMLFFKILIEYFIVLIFYNFLSISKTIVLIILALLKIAIIISLKNKIFKINEMFYKKWERNDFYIRYIFAILLFLYFIVSGITVIFY